jgi:hypothetical protein
MADPEAIYNWQRLDNRMTTSGQPTEKQLADIHPFVVGEGAAPRGVPLSRSSGTNTHWSGRGAMAQSRRFRSFAKPRSNRKVRPI